MNKRHVTAMMTIVFLVLSAFFYAEAKTKSLQEIEGDRIVVLNIDRKAKLPKPFLKKDEAQKYIGSWDDLKRRVTKNLYTGENVIRHAKSDLFLNISDGIIFNTGGGKIGYVRRKDGAFTVIIDYSQGRKLPEVDEALFDRYAIVMNDDCPNSFVFFDKDRQEAAIIFLPRSMRVEQYLTQEGLVAIEVSERI